MIEAVIFDVDGVLINSVEVAYGSKTKVLQEYGVNLADVPDPHGEDHKAASAKTLLEAVESHSGQAIDRAEFISKVGHRIYEDLKKSGVSADPNLVRLLSELRENNVPLAIVTSNAKKSVHNKLKILGIESFFTVIINADDVKAHKPHPEPYLTAISRLGANAANCIVFEDSLAGVQSGVAAGAVVIGFTQYNADKSPLKGATICIDGWGDVSYGELAQLVT